MGNNSVCWGSRESSSLVQRFLNMASERIEAVLLSNDITSELEKNGSYAIPVQHANEGNCWCFSVCILHVFMSDVIKENSILGKVFFFGCLLETGKSVNIFKIPQLLSYIFTWKKRNDSTLRADVYL